MTPEERATLERVAKLAEESNDILRKMRRTSRISGFMHILYWAVIILISLGAYYFVQPYIDMAMKLYGQVLPVVQGAGSSIDSTASSLEELTKFLQSGK